MTTHLKTEQIPRDSLIPYIHPGVGEGCGYHRSPFPVLLKPIKTALCIDLEHPTETMWVCDIVAGQDLRGKVAQIHAKESELLDILERMKIPRDQLEVEITELKDIQRATGLYHCVISAQLKLPSRQTLSVTGIPIPGWVEILPTHQGTPHQWATPEQQFRLFAKPDGYEIHAGKKLISLSLESFIHPKKRF